MLDLLVALALNVEAPPAPVVAAVVYPDRATVTRRLRTPCDGSARALFSHLPPGAHPDSFQARATGARVIGLRLEDRLRPDAFSARVEQLDARIGRLDAALAASHHELARLDGTGETSAAFEAVAKALISREMALGHTDVQRWRQALAAVERTGLDAARARTPVAAALRAQERERAALAEERAGLAAAASRTEQTVEVLLSCDAAGESASVDLDYLVGGASWSPAYEARVRGEATTLELTTLATIEQRTGEDWRQARVTLSTALPRQSATPPTIEPLAVYADRSDPPEKKVVTRLEEAPHAAGADTRAAGGSAALNVAAQGLSVQLALPDPADVPGDGTAVRLLVARSQLPATPHLRTTPKMAPYLFRVADTANGAAFPLLAGPIDVYQDGNLVGRHRLDEVPSGGRFTVGLGIEPRVRVTRLVLQEVDRSAGLFGGARRHLYAYRFQLASHLPRTATIELCDHLPVTELEDVEVVIEPRTTAGYTRDPREGLLRWRLSLTPGATSTVELAFRVEVPSRYR